MKKLLLGAILIFSISTSTCLGQTMKTKKTVAEIKFGFSDFLNKISVDQYYSDGVEEGSPLLVWSAKSESTNSAADRLSIYMPNTEALSFSDALYKIATLGEVGASISTKEYSLYKYHKDYIMVTDKKSYEAFVRVRTKKIIEVSEFIKANFK